MIEQPIVYSLQPTGWTGGRIYLRMVHDALADVAHIITLPDPKRGYRHRRWRKLRHLAALAPHLGPLRDKPGVFVWDDLSVLWFTPAMRRRTIFVFHHHDRLHYDSAPLEPLLWRALFAALRDCAAVVCVSPYWASWLAARGIASQVIYNAIDPAPFEAVRSIDRQQLRRQSGLPRDRTLVYVGKAVHGKGVELAHALLADQPDLCLVSTGNNTIGARTHHTGWLPYADHLRTIRACDIGVFLSTLHEGWSRCAAEAILLDLPCLTSGIAGLGDLGRLTNQPVADLPRLDEQLRARARTPPALLVVARERLSAFDTHYFTTAWQDLLLATCQSDHGDPALDPLQHRGNRPGWTGQGVQIDTLGSRYTTHSMIGSTPGSETDHPMLDRAVIDTLFPADLPEPEHWERHYPPRQLADGAQVTRFGPSPTGFVHIGGVYVATIDRDIATHSNGVYLVRVEDTDQSREVEGALAQFARAFDYFGINSDEDDAHGDYGPYHQSAREHIYLTYVRHLLRQGKAYLCFATKDELAHITAQQQAAKIPTGYYGRWAIWRDADPADVTAKLAEGVPYVVRYRAPDDAHAQRARFTDAIRGELEHEANRNDAVILKSSDTAPRLPTYHFAHAVDDHLMRVNLVIRGEEWISSVPLHQQLFDALGFPPITYAHIAPLMKQIPGGKRKLSKRKDPEASVDFYLAAGYPAPAILYYLRGLANGRLAELPLAEALASPIQLDQCGVAGPLVDLVKLDDISANYIATLSSQQVFDAVHAWAVEHDPDVATALAADPALALRAIAVEREGVDNPRKDLRKWSDFRTAYGFFFPQLFTPMAGAKDDRLDPVGLAPEIATSFVSDLLDGYQHLDDPQAWFNQIRELTAKHGFAPSPKEYKKNPDAYPGSIREASQLVRVALTGSTRSPDLHAVAQALGEDEVRRRLLPFSG